jgi:hypothetical protein
MSLISNIGAYTYTDKISAISVAPTPYNNTGNYYNIVYIGTSNGRIYLYNESTDVTSMTSIVPTGYTGTLSGEITGLAVDPTGKYLFINAPYDRHCLRLSLTAIASGAGVRTITVPIDRDIYRFGDNTGSIVVDSQGVVYIVTGGGTSISTMERYGNSFVNLFFLNQYPVLNFKGIALSANEQRIYALDLRFGSIYYYDFLTNQPTFNVLSAIGTYSGLRDVAVSGNNVFYSQTSSIYAQNSYLQTTTRVVGSGISGYVATTDPQKFTLSGANTVATNPAGDIYLAASNALGNSSFYKVTFSLPTRNGYQAPPSRQELPVLQPFPTTSCKRIVEPFNPRLRFGWGLTNTKKPPILDVVKSPLCCPPPIVNCAVTPFYCLPTPPPIFPPQPVAPVFPITVPTRQFGDCALSTGFRNIISLDSNVVTTTSLAFVSQNSTVQPALGPLGEVYYMAENGALFKMYNGQSRQIFSTGASNKIAGPVVSTTGAVVVATDLGQLYRLDSNASVFQFFPIRLGQQIGGSPACITNGAFDYIVACYGNTIGAYEALDAGSVWSARTQGSGELFRTSVTTDGISVFAGTTNGRVYAYVAETGKLNWVYSIPGATIAPFTPYASAFSIGVTVPNDSNIFILSNTTVRVQAYDIKVTLSGLKIASPPIISTDPQGGLWAHVINASGHLYGFGGIVASTSGYGYSSLWCNAVGEYAPPTYQTPVLDTSGNIYISTLSGTINQYRAYYTASSTQTYTLSGRLVLNGKTESAFADLPIQVSATPLITTQNTMYVVSRLRGTNSNYMYTISG